MTDPRWPDYCTKKTLARRLDCAVGNIDQLVKRGLLPPPIVIDGAPRWRWQDVDSHFRNAKVEGESHDPYMAGLTHAAEIAAARRQGPQ